MNKLIAAAKAVIDARVFTGVHRERLRAAVERAEKQEVVGFEEFLETKYPLQLLTKYDIKYLKEAWTAAQQAERERILDILHENRDVFMEGGFCLVAEKIDDL